VQWIGETIDAPITGSLDTDVEQVATPFGRDLLHVLQTLQDGDFSVRMVSGHDGVCGGIAEAVNVIAGANQRIAQQLGRIGEEVGREGRIRQRFKLGLSGGGWGEIEDQLNRLIDNLLWPTTAVTRAAAALANGDPPQAVALDVDGRPLNGDFLQTATIVNAMILQLGVFAAEITRVAREIAAEGKLGAQVQIQAQVREAAGVWSDVTQGLNAVARGVSARIRTIADVVELERRVAEGAAELERSKSRLRDSEDSRILALAAGKMGSWDWDLANGHCLWDAGQRQIFGADPVSFEVALSKVRALIDRSDWKMLCRQLKRARQNGGAWQLEFRVRRPDGGVRWCFGTAVAARDASGRISRIRGITMDITERKDAEDRQALLAREVDHRTKNALAVVHAIVSLTRADDVEQFSAAVEGRIQALARAHSLLSDSRWRGAKIADLIQGELAPFRTAGLERIRISGRSLALPPSAVQALALTVHELAANAARHGALSVPSGCVRVAWEQQSDEFALRWLECGGPCLHAHGIVREGSVRESLGMRIIRASVETQLGGSVEFDWRPDGLCCAIRIPCHPKAELLGNFLHSIQTPGAWRRMPALS
jgi:two-component sensor histidine kinase/PAS domain-containing protein